MKTTQLKMLVINTVVWLVHSMNSPTSTAIAQQEHVRSRVSDIELRERDERQIFFLSINDEQLRAQIATRDSVDDLVQVFTVVEGRRSQRALFGAVTLDGGALLYTPRFPLRPGMTYRVVAADEIDLGPRDFKIPDTAKVPSTSVVEVFPSQEIVPENLLKFYVQFSSPMGRGLVYEHSRIIDEDGNQVELAFLEIEEELWDATRTRVTLLFDPGRIKRELRPRQEIGSPLREGRRYVLEIDKAWGDADGIELIETYRKSFGVSEHDETCPDPKEWKVSTPRRRSTDPLVIRFNEPLDRAMLEHVIAPVDEVKRQIEGTIQIDEQEMQWTFTPSEPWSTGNVFLRIATSLEDRAGNTIQKPFEVDLTKPFESNYPDEFTYVPVGIE